MNPTRHAVIDVGTNSIKLLIADVGAEDVQPILEQSHQTRLGRGFYETHRLQPQAVAQTAEAVAAFADLVRKQAAVSIRVIATSAARDAKNPGDLLSAIHHASGLSVEIISGEQEAEWAFQGVTSDATLALQPLLLLDVGGGSTEFILGRGQRQHFRHSFPLGTVRLLEKLPHSDPPTAVELASCRDWLRRFLEAEVRPRLEPALEGLRKPDGSAGVTTQAPTQLVGTGGTATLLSRMALKMEGFDRAQIEANRHRRNELRETVDRLWSLPLAARKQIPGLPPNRADVILTGVAIYEAVMDTFAFEELRISTRGLRFAAVVDAARRWEQTPGPTPTTSAP